VRTGPSLPKVWAFVRARLAEGRQAYVVYPRVEDAGEGVRAVTKEFETLEKELAPYKAGLLHGRLNSAQKESVMTAFRACELDVLLSTSLIEVGIDVPNATVMLIENAEQFGLAQLHQLRGRIGRGSHESYCILITRARHLKPNSASDSWPKPTTVFGSPKPISNGAVPVICLASSRAACPPCALPISRKTWLWWNMPDPWRPNCWRELEVVDARL